MLPLVHVDKNETSPDCLYSSIATVANSMRPINNKIIGAGAWWFNIQNLMPGQGDVIWNRIHAFRYDAWKCLETFYGVRVIWHNTSRAEEMLPDLLSELDSGRPVLIYINSHYCPWHPRQKEYNAHFCLVLDYDKENKEFICMDVNPERYQAALPMELFEKGCGPYLTFAESDRSCIEVNWKEVVSSAVENLSAEGISAFDSMRYLAYEVKKEIKEAGDGVPVWIEDPVSLISKTGLLEKGRNYFAQTLDYLAEEFQVEELKEISKKFVESAQQWKVVSFLAMKSRMMRTDKTALERIPDKILEIADFEEKIAQELVELLQKYTTLR